MEILVETVLFLLDGMGVVFDVIQLALRILEKLFPSLDAQQQGCDDPDYSANAYL